MQARFLGSGDSKQAWMRQGDPVGHLQHLFTSCFVWRKAHSTVRRMLYAERARYLSESKWLLSRWDIAERPVGEVFFVFCLLMAS